MPRWVLGALCCLGCVVDDPLPPAASLDDGCAPTLESALQVTQAANSLTPLTDGGSIVYGYPPQGGAPYAAFDVRLDGIPQGEDGLWVEIFATTMEGEELGYAGYQQWFLCSNTGDNEGWLVTSEFHLLFFGYSLDELEGVEMELVVRAENVAGDVLASRSTGWLVRED